jgi:hypothetical protein
MKCQIYLMASNDSEVKRQQHAAITYCASRGWDSKPSSESWSAIATKPGEGLKETLSTLLPGDVLLINNVQSLSDRPSPQEKIVRELLGRGVRLHSIELGGDINAHLPGLFAAWASCASVEQELDQALSDRAQQEERHQQDMRDFEEDLTSRILREGVSITVGKAPNGNGAADHSLGDAIKTARIKRNLSQRQLAERCDISHTEMQRIEQLGYGKNIERVMVALGMEGKGGGLLNTPAPEALDVD